MTKIVTFNEMVLEVQEEVSNTYKNAGREKVITTIKDLRDELNGIGVSGKIFQNYNISELSSIAGRLAVLRASLVEYRNFVHTNVQIAKAKLSVHGGSIRQAVKKAMIDKARAAGAKDPSVDDISSEVSRQLARAQLTLDLHTSKYEELQSYWYAIPEMLSTISSRINYLNGDRGTSNNYSGAVDQSVETLVIPEIDYRPALGEEKQA